MTLKIAATVFISLSEIQTVAPWCDEEFIENNQEVFKQMLYDLGADVYQYPIEVQDVTHRNKFGNIITCKRWVCNERVDPAWVTSGHASYEATAKSANNKILTDLFRMRGMVESA